VWERRSTDTEPPMTSFLAEQLGTAHWFDQRETRAALEWEPKVSLAQGFQRLSDWFAEDH
jgi:nucleoside-diphosphate-sugar epimerase